jgi:serine/threonine protein kinase
MTATRQEGQNFDRFTLLEQIGDNEIAETWVALNSELSERVCLRIYKQALPEELIARTASQIDRHRGLIHQHIARVYEIGTVEGTQYLCSQYIQHAVPFDPGDRSFSHNWTVLKPLFEAIEFAHGLGFAHGQLHPGNLLVDGSGELSICGFGLPRETAASHRYDHFMCATDGAAFDTSDDVYGLGCIVYRSLTGHDWQPGEGFKTDRPVPADIQALVENMLSPSEYERSRELGHIREVLTRFVDENDDDNLLAANPFEKSQPSPITEAQVSSHTLPRERRQIPLSTVVVALIIIVAMAGIVFVYLPGTQSPISVDSQPIPTQSAPAIPSGTDEAQPPSEVELAPMEIAQIELAKQQGKDTAARIIRLQVELEDIGVVLWARDTYDSLVSSAESADDLYREESYREALAVYENALTELEALQATAPLVLSDSTADGDAALAGGEAMAALQAFTIATAIDSDDPDLQEKLVRAENLSQVQSHIRAAKQAELDGDLDNALALFGEALSLDGLWQPAIDGVDRMTRAVTKRQFDDAMSSAFSALARRDYGVASEFFALAAQIIPDSTEPEDGMLQIELAERVDAIEKLKASAEAHSAAEQWQKAMDDFNAALELDASLVFAIDGLAVVEKRMTIDSDLAKYLNQPTLMQEDSELALARQAIVAASRVAEASPLLTERMNRLSRLISVARIPIPVTIQSDRRTDVTVYRIGHLGKIDSTGLQLNPGAYTIVGKRAGYRDVQYKLELLAGVPVSPIYISCNEKI